MEQVIDIRSGDVIVWHRPGDWAMLTVIKVEHGNVYTCIIKCYGRDEDEIKTLDIDTLDEWLSLVYQNEVRTTIRVRP
jgi:hypothetical protein